MKTLSQSLNRSSSYPSLLVTLETGAGALVADDGALDEMGLSAVGGDHHSLARLGLDGYARLAVGLNQRVDREALGLHGDALGVHLRKE